MLAAGVVRTSPSLESATLITSANAPKNRLGTNVTDDTGAGLSRRDLIKRGAVVGGVVWAAPVVQSLSSPAFAGTPGGGECENFFRFKFNLTNGVFVPDGGTTLPGGDECEIDDFATLPLGNDKVVLVGSDFDSNGRPRTVTVSDNPGDTHDCTVEVLLVKAGARASVGAGLVCATDTDGDGTVSTATGKAISYVAGVICCD